MTLRAKRKEAFQNEARTAQRNVLIEAAGRLLLNHGPAALSLRRIASEVGASTTVAYTLFGGKEGVVAALRKEGFERLSQAFGRVRPGRDPLSTLKGYGLAYREFALADPAFFSLMAGRALPGVEPASARGIRTTGAYLLFKEAVQACIRRQVFPRGDPESIADGLWAVAHGMASLELAGYFPNRETARTRFLGAITAAARGYAKARRLASRSPRSRPAPRA